VSVIDSILTDEKVRKQIADVKKKEHGIRLIRGAGRMGTRFLRGKSGLDYYAYASTFIVII
jgi:hypothetical protein